MRLIVIIAALVGGAAGPSWPMLLDLSDDQARRIGIRIYRNECGSRPENLLTWNPGETFLSLGIGHFIWYPEGIRPGYRESFPALLSFMGQSGTPLPKMLSSPHGPPPCPWPDRNTFMASRTGPEAERLRAFLEDTLDVQVRYMVRRLEAALPSILSAAGSERRQAVHRNYARLARTPMGRYALVDYVNFKGEGTLPSERVAGEGWGLLQVLAGMDPVGAMVEPRNAFVESADRILTRRAMNDPRPHVRTTWLPGWRKRLETYRDEHL